MAEFVELRAEEWAPELEELEKIRLFLPEELRAVASKRREIEYKIQRKSKTKEDYLKFLQFEIDLLRLIKYRRNERGVAGSQHPEWSGVQRLNEIYMGNIKFQQMNIHTHQAVIEGAQITRIVKLFKQVIFRHQSDVKLWMSFFKYCSEMNLAEIGSEMLVRMLQVHADKEKLWSFAAKWEYESIKSTISARKYLLNGIRHHPKSRLLFTELFKLELNYATVKRKEIEGGDPAKRAESSSKNVEDVINLKLAEVVYNSCKAKVKGVEFKADLLKLATDYPNTAELQNIILKDLLDEHMEEEVTWDVIARRKYKGLYVEETGDNAGEKPMEVDGEKTRPVGRRAKILAAVDTYKKAVKKLNTPKMWKFYLDFMFQIKKAKSTALSALKSNLLRKALKGAFDAEKIEEKHITLWVEMLSEIHTKPKNQALILKKITERFPNSINFWTSRLKHYMLRNKEKCVMKVFNQSLEHITGEESFPLWKMVIHYYQTISTEKVEELFKSGTDDSGPLADLLKPMYLQWLALTKGVGHAKSFFENDYMTHPPCLEVMNKMISLEMMQPDVNKKFIRRCHEMACRLAGKNNLDVWISYVEFELQFGDGEGPFVIYLRAVRSLCAELVDEFISKYNALQIDS